MGRKIQEWATLVLCRGTVRRREAGPPAPGIRRREAGPPAKQKEKALKEERKLEKILQRANVQVQVTETNGAVTATGEFSGIQKDALNILVSDQTLPNGVGGMSGTTTNGIPLTQIDINAMSTDIWIPSVLPLSVVSWSSTWVHEYGEQFLHVGQESSFFANLFGDIQVDRLMQGLAVSVPGYPGAVRSTLAEKRYAAPVTPEANKPSQ